MGFLGYIRISDVNGRNGDSFISPDVQGATITHLAQAKGLELGEVVTELDVSGGKRAEDRKLGALVRQIENGEAEGLIVWRLSRFSRSLLDAVETTTRITAAGGRLIAEDFDSAQPMGKALLGLLAGLAEEELDARRKGWAEARARAVNRGVPCFATPYGYERGEDGRLVAGNGTAETVRRIFQLKAQGKNLSSIARELDGTPSPRGGSKWPHSTLAQVLRNRAYLGEVQHGDFMNREAHEPLIDRATFELAQATRPRREPSPENPNPRSAETIAAGLARCGGCGHTLKIVPKGYSVLRYYCKSASYKDACPARALIRVDVLDPYLEAWFLSAIEGRTIAAEQVQAREGLTEAQQGLEGAENALRVYAETATILDPSDFQQGLQARKRALDEARTAVSELRGQAASLGNLPGDLLALWPSLLPVEKRELIGSLVDRIEVDKGREPAAQRVRIIPA